jgi:hypothetical protein
VQQQGDLRPDPAELQDPATEDELDWEGDPDDLLSVLVEVKPETPEHS